MPDVRQAVQVWKQWQVVAKVDPDKPLCPSQVDSLAASGVDAVVLGGTQGITRDKVATARQLLAPTGLPVALEVSAADAILPDMGLFLIPVVLNTPDARWVTGAHQSVALALQGHLDWSRVAAEGYIVLNPSSAVARLTSAQAPLAPEEAAAFAEVGVRVLGLPLVYLEYSGTYGSPDVVRACRRAIAGTGARLVYGGGIATPGRAAEMAAIADTIVIGNLVHTPDHVRLPEVVAAARTQRRRA